MTRLTWGEEKPYEAGVDRGVLYLADGAVPWNGLVGVEESDTGEIHADQFFDANRFRLMQNVGEYGALVEAITYPPAFESYEGVDGYLDQQGRKFFDFSYRSHGSGSPKIHLVYNALATPSPRGTKTLTGSVDLSPFSWSIATVPREIPGARPGSHLVIEPDSARHPEAVETLEGMLYGTDISDPYMPSPEDVVAVFESYVIFRVEYNGDGTFTAMGPDDWITVHGDGTYEITSPSAFYIDEHTHQISSY